MKTLTKKINEYELFLKGHIDDSFPANKIIPVGSSLKLRMIQKYKSNNKKWKLS